MPYDREDEQLAEQLDALREEAPFRELPAGFDVGAAEQDLENDRRARVDRAIELLDAEVAAHEEAESVHQAAKAGFYHGSGEIEPYLVRHPEMLEDLDPDVANGIDASTGLSLGGPIVEPVPPAGEARFGERLRVALRHHRAQLTAPEVWTLEPIAAAIDHDAETLRGELAGKQRALELVRADIRRQVEEAVERGRYSVSSPFHPKGALFMEALGAIFGERSEETGTQIWERLTAKQRQELLGHLDPAAGVRLISRLCDGIETMKYGGTMGEAAEAEIALLEARQLLADINGRSEHEPAHDRRERESARHEDRDGRVEGVDR